MGPETADTTGQPAAQQDSPPSAAIVAPESELAFGLPSAEPPAGELPASELPASELLASELAEPPSPIPSLPATPRPSFVFFGIVAGLSLASDIATKVWAELTLNQRGFEPLELIKDHLAITLAYNRGGAWGLFATASELVRKPFFLGVSVAAIAFIISLYARLTLRQKALRWGLPLVLGGALGNLNDRITRSQVIDFIDFRADWIMDLNVFVHRYVPSWAMTDHWPTFNVADVAICIGVGLMAVDMFTHRPRRVSVSPVAPLPGEPALPHEQTLPGEQTLPSEPSLSISNGPSEPDGGAEVRLDARPEARPDAPPAMG